MTIRDFLYLDADLLRSLIAQTSDGITDRVYESAGDAIKDNLQGTGLLDRNFPHEESTTYASRGESRIYQDNLFSKLEAALKESVVTVNAELGDSLSRCIQKAFLLRVTGRAQIEDYARVEILLDNFEKISLALANAQQESEEHQATIETAQELVRSLPAGPDRVLAENSLKTLKDPKKRVGSTKTLESLKIFLQVFRKSAFEIATQVPGIDYVFRSVIDPNWLRIAPDRLRRLYGLRTQFEFTVVGEITFLPDDLAGKAEEANGGHQATVAVNDQDSSASMGDALRNIIQASESIEASFTQSSLGLEVVLRPLAIYREATIADPVTGS